MTATENRRPRNPLAYVIVLAIVSLIVATSILNSEEEERASVIYARELMGTIVELTLIDGERPRFEPAAEAAFAEINRLVPILSNYDPYSDASLINRSEPGDPVTVAQEAVDVVAIALEIAELSGGAFDPTVGALASLWGYSGESGRVPAKEEVAALLPLVDYKSVEADLRHSTVTIKKPGVKLNLGGVAKGYIVGRAIDALKRAGVSRGIVRAGGDMTVFDARWGRGGRGGRGEPFNIGIRHPRETEKLLGEVYVRTGAVATSGDYERFFEAGGKRYHHILDPRTGFPAEGVMSATVVSENPTRADALSTAVFVMGIDAGMKLIESLEGVEGVIVSTDGKIKTSSGFEGHITGL